MAALDVSPEELLTSLSTSLSEEDIVKTLNTFELLYQNLKTSPDDERFKRIRLANKKFNESIFAHPLAFQFLLQCGWVEADGYMVFYEDINMADIALGMIRQSKSTLSAFTTTSQSQKVTQPEKVAQQNDQQDEQRLAQLKLLKEHQKKVAEERKIIADKIRSDREETTQKESRSSKSQVREYGGNVNRFGDIGVDLNKGG